MVTTPIIKRRNLWLKDAKTVVMNVIATKNVLTVLTMYVLTVSTIGNLLIKQKGIYTWL